MRSRLVALLSLSLLAGTLSACADATSGPTDSSSPSADQNKSKNFDEAELGLSVDPIGNTDIAAVRFNIDPVVCPQPPNDTQAPASNPGPRITEFEDVFLPGGIPEFEENPYDAESQHLAADRYFFLDAGCYDITAEPLSTKAGAGGQPQVSKQCKTAEVEDVRVRDGRTTEKQMIIQCPGEPRGGLDAVATVNHEPSFDDVRPQPDKFAETCYPTQLCAEVTDPDGDPMTLQWRQIAGPNLEGGIQVASSNTSLNQDGSRTTTECINVKQSVKGKYEFRVRAFDMAFDDQQNMVRIQNLLKQQKQPQAPKSRDVQRLFFYGAKDCPARGRSVTALWTFSNMPGIGKQGGRQLLDNISQWVKSTINPDPPVLVVLDDDNEGEDVQEANWIRDRLQNAGYSNVSVVTEDPNGLRMSTLMQFRPQVLIFTNPGWSPEDQRTIDTLLTAREQLGVGLLVAGDDFSRARAGSGITAAEMQSLTGLSYQNDNGASACGATTDNNAGQNFTISLLNTGHPILTQPHNLQGVSVPYGNDLDLAQSLGRPPVNNPEIGLHGTANFSQGQCSFDTDVLVTLDPGP